VSNTSVIERQIDAIAHDIDQMNRLYRRALAGDPHLEIDALDRVEDSIRRTLRALHNTNMQRAADRFRLSNLEARFHTYLEMFQRRQRLQEEGRDPLAPEARAAGSPRHLDPETGILVGKRPTPAAVEALFNELYSKSGRRLKMDLDSFQRYLQNQVSQIQAKTGCESVQFRLEGQGDAVKLKARPVHDANSKPA
jgi:hypothetical protein